MQVSLVLGGRIDVYHQFDEPNLVSAAGLVPVMEPVERTGLSALIAEHVHPPSTRVRSGAVTPVATSTSIIAGMLCGAGRVDDAGALRAGGRFGDVDQAVDGAGPT